jgi:hypothetical protein
MLTSVLIFVSLSLAHSLEHNPHELSLVISNHQTHREEVNQT